MRRRRLENETHIASAHVQCPRWSRGQAAVAPLENYDVEAASGSIMKWEEVHSVRVVVEDLNSCPGSSREVGPVREVIRFGQLADATDVAVCGEAHRCVGTGARLGAAVSHRRLGHGAAQ